MSETHHAPIGELLVEHGGMSEEHLRAALEEQRTTGRPLGEIVVERGYVPAAMVAQALATQQGGLTKTEYGYATGWAQALDERDRAIAELRRWAESAQAAIAARDAELDQLRAAVAAAEAAAPAADDELDRLRAELAAENATVASRDAELEQLRGELAEARRAAEERDRLQAQVTSLEADVAAATERTAGLETASREGEAALQAELDAVHQRSEAREGEIRDLRRQLENAASRAATLAVRADAAERRVAEVEEAAAAHRDRWQKAESHLLFVRRADGYELVERDGPPPAAGETVDDGLVQRVAALGGTPCAYLID